MAVRGRSIAWVTVTLFALGALAGCVSEEDGPVAPPEKVAEFVDPMLFSETHDHADYAQHNLSWNAEELGWTSILPDAAVAWGELDIKTFGERNMAVVAFAWPTAGFATVDVSDPAAPVLLDSLDVGYGYGADVKWLDSGDFAVLAVQTHSQRHLPSLPVGPGDPIAALTENGLIVYHITPEGAIHDIGSWTPGPTGGVHMVYTHVINGEEYIFAAYNGRGVMVYRFQWNEPPLGAQLVLVNRVLIWYPTATINNPVGLGMSGAHDMTVVEDPLLGKPILWMAGGYWGLWAFDVSDPEGLDWPDNPIGFWKDPGNTWYMHTAQSTVIGDKRYVVIVPEVFSEAEIEVVAPLWVLDATDLAKMTVAATWKNPGDHGADQLRYSVHNFQVVGETIALAHYHGGVWLLDLLNDTGEVNVTSIGYHLPANDPGRAMSGIYHGVYHMEDAPTVWDVVVKDGVVWATDVNSGLYAIGTPAFSAGDMSATSIG